MKSKTERSWTGQLEGHSQISKETERIKNMVSVDNVCEVADSKPVYKSVSGLVYPQWERKPSKSLSDKTEFTQ